MSNTDTKMEFVAKNLDYNPGKLKKPDGGKIKSAIKKLESAKDDCIKALKKREKLGTDQTNKKVNQERDELTLSIGAAEKKMREALNSLKEADPEKYVSLMRYKLNKHKGKEEASVYANAADFLFLMDKGFETGDPLLINATFPLGIMFKNKNDRKDLAEAKPEEFLWQLSEMWGAPPSKHLKQNLKDLLLDPALDPTMKRAGTEGQLIARDTGSKELRDMLRDKAPDAWRELAATIPVLALPEAVFQQNLPKDEALASIFDKFIKNDGIKVGYFTVSKDRTENIMMGENEQEKKERVGDGEDDVPRTQCDDLMKILRATMQSYPGSDVEVKRDMEKDCLLTVPLNTLPRDGLIGRGFGGNVLGIDGNPTKQILFTGDTGAESANSHTWLIVDDVPFDAVLGTQGDEVANSKQASFKKNGEQWEEVGGERVLKVAGGQQASANPYGFTTMYQFQ